MPRSAGRWGKDLSLYQTFHAHVVRLAAHHIAPFLDAYLFGSIFLCRRCTCPLNVDKAMT